MTQAKMVSLLQLANGYRRVPRPRACGHRNFYGKLHRHGRFQKVAPEFENGNGKLSKAARSKPEVKTIATHSSTTRTPKNMPLELSEIQTGKLNRNAFKLFFRNDPFGNSYRPTVTDGVVKPAVPTLNVFLNCSTHHDVYPPNFRALGLFNYTPNFRRVWGNFRGLANSTSVQGFQGHNHRAQNPVHNIDIRTNDDMQ